MFANVITLGDVDCAICSTELRESTCYYRAATAYTPSIAMQQEEKMQAARPEREHTWSVFTARYGFELFKHAHEACYGARGRLDGLDLTVAEQLEGLEFFAAHVLPEAFELVLCEKKYWQWCRDPARIRTQEKAVRVVDRTRRKLREPALSPGLMAAHLPRAATPLSPATGIPIFDRSCQLLFPNFNTAAPATGNIGIPARSRRSAPGVKRCSLILTVAPVSGLTAVTPV
jgi:hypothetical protein